MPEKLLTIGDVWQPSQADDYAKLIRFGDEMENAKLRNRVSAMQMGEAEFNKRQRDSTMQAAGGEQAYFKQQQQLENQKQIKTQVDSGISIIKNFKRVLGVDGLKSNWDKISPLLPEVMKDKINPENFNEDGYTERSKETGEVIGQWVEKPDGTGSQFVPAAREPVSTEANYRQGIENQLKEEHPDWSTPKIRFEASKQVRKENAEEARNRAANTIVLREGAELRKEARVESRSYKGWSPQAKTSAILDKLITGKKPDFSWGDRYSYTKFGEDYYNYINSNKISLTQIAAARADLKAKDKSVSNQRKIYDMMNGFVMNLNKQVVEVKDIYSKLPRTQWKLLNIPIKQLRTKVTGSGEEAAAKSFLIEISNEIGKLSTGGAASIRELGEQAQKQWKEIHDETLPVKDIMIVLDATQEQANMRLNSSKEAMDYTLRGIEKLNIGGSPKSSIPAFDVSGEDAEAIMQVLKKRGVIK